MVNNIKLIYNKHNSDVAPKSGSLVTTTATALLQNGMICSFLDRDVHMGRAQGDILYFPTNGASL